MIDHYTLLVRDYARSKAFYAAALEPLGYGLVMELTRAQVPSLGVPATCGFGAGKPDLWLAPTDGEIASTHIALHRRGGRLTLLNPSKRMGLLLSISRLASVIEIHPTA